VTTPHRLEPLLNPRSVALVGVSERPGSVGAWLLDTFMAGGYQGELFLVNPRYQELAGRPCYPELGALPNVPEMAVLNVGSNRMEALVDQVIELGVPAVTIFDYCDVEDDTEPNLMARLRAKAAEANLLICGGGGMGFYNLDAKLHASYYHAAHLQSGHISLLAHSGSVFTVLAMADPRHRFNLIVSMGSEIATSVDAFLDYAVQMPTTRVVAMFVESVRNPAGFVRALEAARANDIPVVVCKIGKTEKSAAFAQTHTGAIAGSSAAFEAVLERYGALSVDTVDELMATAMLFSHGQRAGPGGLGAILDSGGLRQLLVDVADKLDVPLAKLSAETIAEIEKELPHTLEADNPLDAAGPFSYDFELVFRHCLSAIVDDDDTAVGWFEFDATDRFNPVPEQVTTAKTVGASTPKPLVVVNSSSSTLNTDIAADLYEHGIPLINGVQSALVAVKKLLEYRDYRLRPKHQYAEPPESATVERWRKRLAGCGTLNEVEGLQLLSDFGMTCTPCRVVDNLDDVLKATSELGYPLVLKTAETGIAHKSDVQGVHLDLRDESMVRAAYAALADKLGPSVTVAATAPPGVELGLGFVNDPQFGPMVVISAGGVLIELMKDRATLLTPIDINKARRAVEKLGVYPLLNGVRGASPTDIDALLHAIVQFSLLAESLRTSISEMDVNPILVSTSGAVAVDALVVAVGD